MLKPKYKKTLDYLQTIADSADHDGYFYIDIEKAWRTLDISRRTLFNHLDKLKDYVFKVYNGSFVPERLAKYVLWDSEKKIITLSSLYYIPRESYDSQNKRDAAILKFCFGWTENKLKHFLWWSDFFNQELDESPCGLSEKTQELLEQYFKYMVNNEFDWDNPEFADEFERLCKLSDKLHSVF